MRRILTGFAMAAVMAAIPSLGLAGNQEIAEQIARSLRQSGKISDYKIGVKYQDGTAWLRGRVNDEEQMGAALKVAFHTPGVKRVVNELTIASTDSGSAAPKSAVSARNSSRGHDVGSVTQKKQKASLAHRLEAVTGRDSEQDVEDSSARADRVPSSFAASPAEKTSVEEPQESLPQRMVAPKRVKPVAPNYMAMQQAGPRGPTAPNGAPLPMYSPAANPAGVTPARYDQPCMPNYAWPSYAAYPNYAGVTYPKQYSPTAWPYIGPFYPYPQVPLGWRKVTLEWDSGWWFLDFKDQPSSCWHK